MGLRAVLATPLTTRHKGQVIIGFNRPDEMKRVPPGVLLIRLLAFRHPALIFVCFRATVT